jgi:glycosyltransferase involved in cell wall biosynthesis
VLHVDTGREWRGGQTQMRHVVRASSEVAVALPPDAPARAAIEQAGAAVYPIPFRGRWRGTRALRAAIEVFAPDVVAAQTSHAHAHAVRARDLAPVVVHRRVDFAIASDPIARRTYAEAAGYVAVSGAVAAILGRAGVPRARVVVVPDGVRPEPPRQDREAVRASLGVPSQAPLIVAVGALVGHKAHRVLVEAARDLPGTIVMIAGEGPLRGALEQQIRAAGVGARVRLLGQRGDVPDLLGAADVFCHCSDEEGMGQAVVEAMFAGLPVVATAAGGVPEVVTDGATGWLVPVGDAKALARALSFAAADRAEAARRAQAARSTANERFSVSRMVADTLAAYGSFAR